MGVRRNERGVGSTTANELACAIAAGLDAYLHRGQYERSWSESPRFKTIRGCQAIQVFVDIRRRQLIASSNYVNTRRSINE